MMGTCTRRRRYLLTCAIECRLWVFFFFQAEDGIRDVAVTGVQTCALPIWVTFCPEGAQALAALRVPELDGAICTGGGEHPTIRTKRHPGDLRSVAMVRAQKLSTWHSPELECPLSGAGDQQGAIGAKSEVRDSGCLAAERVYQFPRGDGPELHG